ncbi:sulfatase [Niabella ginsenosidivorans]|uniref:Sulfatase n=1 Tax=Niabella ginsenosidivorans TaxID=1176587 RepID=A0A1A9I0Q8_9BACT|nr:sulfatase-like hydrolase/transferase [Niabella ginsenosidivorans]ANH80272.1 sulfatase [Niabella ginsenosidivorans]
MHKSFLLLLLFIATLSRAQSEKKAVQPPNILFILVDDLGYGDIGVFNQNARKAQKDPSVPYLITPSLDKMAANGAVFTQQYANAPVCVASRSSLLTGVTQGNAIVRDNQFDKALEDNYTVANTLKQAGYTTVAIGKWGLQGLTKDWPAHPMKRGFDYYFGYMRHSDGHEHYPKEGPYRKPKEVYDGYENVASRLDKCYTGDLWTARAKKWLIDYKRQKKSAPFFMYLAYDTPHATIELPTQEYPKGSGLRGGLQWLGTPGKMINTASGEIDSWMHPLFKNATCKDKATGAVTPWKDVDKRYATVIQRLDQEIGDVLQLLKDLGIDKNTLVVFSSDNGPSQESYLKEPYTPQFFDGYGPFDGIKRDLWEGGSRMPVIVQWPAKIKPGSVIAQASLLSDWAPTFLNAAGMSAPARMDGVSLLPVLSGKGGQRQGAIYSEYFFKGKTPAYPEFEKAHAGRAMNQMQMIRLGNLVGVRYDIKKQEDDFEIYDVVRDPKEKKDLAAQMPGLQQQMKARVLQLRSVNESAPRPYDQELIPAITDQPHSKEIKWSLYKDAAAWVPETSSLQVVKKGTAPAINAGLFKNADANTVTYRGYIRVPADGAYTFYLSVTGNAFFRLHDIPVIDADYKYEDHAEQSRKLLLKAGWHPFTLTYKKNGESPSVNLQWSSAAFSKRAVSAADIY